MAKSKKRGGESAHRKKIQLRNHMTLAHQNSMQKLFNEAMKTQIEELKKKAEAESGTTEN